MSRFFGTGSDSETESSEEDEVNVPRQQALTAATYTFSDDEEEAKRVVRSAREKRYEELKNIIRQIRNHKKNRDMNSMLSCFEDLGQAYQKALPVIQKEEKGITPRFFVRCLVEMEDCVAEVWEDRDGRKNMSKQNSKSLATLRQKLRRYNKDNFEEDIAKFRENPDLPDEEEEEKEDSDSSSESEPENDPAAVYRKKSHSEAKPSDAKAKFLKSAADDDEGSDDSIDWGSDSEDESSSEDDEGNFTNLREKFLKRTTDKEEEEKKKKEKKDKKDKDRRKTRKDDDEKEGEWETVKGAPTTSRPKLFAKDAEITLDSVMKKLIEILAGRGKKGTDRREQIELLSELQTISDAHGLGVGVSIRIRFAIIASIYDYNPKITDAMKPAMWDRLMQRLNDLVDVLLDTPDLSIGEHVLEESEVLDKPPYRIRGCVLTLVERMDEEFVKILKDCDAHSNEYVERLKDEKRVCDFIDRVQSYVERQAQPSEVCRVYLRKVEHLYYKFDSRVIQLKETPAEDEKEETSLDVMKRLCHYIYTKDMTDRLRTRAILCHIYHHALHDNWFEARDLMLMSHLQDSIQHSDPPTQILYNRTMVQLGLCAFRHGNIKDAHNCLADIMMTGKVKELLAQGLLPQIRHKNERSIEQEKIERQRQIPFHMHINLELLECVYLVSAMLIEIPYMAAHEFDARRRLISKTFYQQLRSSERQPLVGPPESMREHVVAASRAMRNGNWRACVNYAINEKMNGKVWGLFYQPDKVKEMLKSKIQEEALRTYLFTYSHVYDCISMVTMSEMFELDKGPVHSIISKMIINEELMASLDEPSQTVVMHRTEPTRLQSLALQLADKVATLVESNDRILELKQGAFFGRGMSSAFRDRQFMRQGQDWGRRGRDNRGGNY